MSLLWLHLYYKLFQTLISQMCSRGLNWPKILDLTAEISERGGGEGKKLFVGGSFV